MSVTAMASRSTTRRCRGPNPGPARSASAWSRFGRCVACRKRLLVAAHQACDLGTLDVAASLLSITEVVLMQPQLGSATAHRRAVEGLVAAHERLWHLKRVDHVDPDPFVGSP